MPCFLCVLRTTVIGEALFTKILHSTALPMFRVPCVATVAGVAGVAVLRFGAMAYSAAAVSRCHMNYYNAVVTLSRDFCHAI